METNTANDIEAFSRNLQASHTSRIYGVTALYITFKTIEANPNITVNQLKGLLQQEYFIPPTIVAGSIASLRNEAMFNCITRFQRTGSDINTSHLHARSEVEYPEVFIGWMKEVTTSFPELLSFHPPRYVKKPVKKPTTQLE